MFCLMIKTKNWVICKLPKKERITKNNTQVYSKGNEFFQLFFQFLNPSTIQIVAIRHIKIFIPLWGELSSFQDGENLVRFKIL